MADKTIKYDNQTPMIMDAAKVRSVMGIDLETGLVGNVSFELFVNEAGKKVGDAVKVVGNELPTMGGVNKRYSVTTGADGLTLTYDGQDFPLNPNSQVDMFWDGIAETWEIERQTALPAVPVANEFGASTEQAASQFMVSERIPHNISNHFKEIDGVAFLNTYLGRALNSQNVPVVFASYAESRYTNYFDVSGIEKIRYIGRYGADAAGMVFLDSDGQIASVLSKTGTGEIDITIDKPETAVIARASSLNSTLEVSFPKYGKNTKRFDEVDSKTGYKSVDFFQFEGYTRYSDGAFIEQFDWRTTDFIPFEDFVEANIWGHANAVASVAYFYSKNQSSYIGAHRVLNTRVLVKKEDLNPPAGTRYIRVSTSGSTGIFPQNTWLTTNKIVGAKEYFSRQMAAVNTRFSSPKFMHMSFDDVLFLLRDLTLFQSNYESIFDNPFLEVLKRLHDVYGAVFSLYCFCEDINTGWTISEVTNKFAEEFSKNSDWLKFGFHSKNSTINYADTTAWYARTDYTAFINAVYHMTGDIDCIDRAVRLHNFAGNLESCEAMRDEPCGITGLLAADDNRNSYYLTEPFLRTHDRVRDTVNHLDFFKTETRLENATITDIDAFLAQFKTPARANTATEMIMFTHENKIYPAVGGGVTVGMVERIESCLRWGYLNGYTFDFPMNRI